MKSRILSTTFLLILLASIAFGVFSKSVSAPVLPTGVAERKSVDEGNLEFVPGEIVVKFKSAIHPYPKNGLQLTGIKSIDRLNERFRVAEVKKSFAARTTIFSNVYKLRVPVDVDVVQMAGFYEADPNVYYAEPNFVYHTFAVPNDADYSQQWAHQNIDSELAWNVETGEPSVMIAIVDTGVDWNHPDLAANIWNNTCEIADNGIDDDNNGFIDDIRGWDFVDVPINYPSFYQPAPEEDGRVRDNDPMDCYGHGTHCSGIAAAVTNNGFGVAGVCWNVRIMPVKSGYKTQTGYGILLNEDAAAGVEYAADNGADVISMSWGGSGSSDLIEEAVEYAYNLGVVLVAAAGNSASNSKSYPAGYNEVIAVAATTSNDDRASFSNYGSWVDVGAPGVNILSTLFNDTYASWSGTSMATPHVAGLSGLILSEHPNFTNEEVRNILRSTTDPVISTSYIGLGRINAYKAILRDTILVTNLDPSLDDAVFYGNINIIGTAVGAYFDYYRIEYGIGVYPTSWTQIGPAHYSPVVNGVLATWDTGSMSEGLYTIRLTAFNVYGQIHVDMVILTVDNSFMTYPERGEFYKTGSSLTITGTATGANFQRYILEYGTGTNPTTWTTNGITLANGGTVRVVDGVLATWNTGVITQANYYTLRLTVYLGNYNGTDSLTIVFDPDYLTGWPKKTPFRLVSTSVAVGDLDENGDLEIVAGETSWNIPYGRNVNAWHHDGTSVTGWPKTNAASQCITSSPALADVDGDGDLEVFVGTDAGKVEAWHHDGSTVANWPVITNGSVQSSPAVADVNRDGYLEIFVGSQSGYVYGWTRTGYNMSGWPQATGGSVLSSPALGDIDNDGDMEIIVGSKDYKVYAWHHNGSLVTGWPKTTGYYVDCSPSLGDIDNDGDLEIFVGSYDQYVYGWHHDGTNVTGWPKAVDGWAISSPALGDIDGDHSLEVVFGSWHGVIYAWNNDGSNVTGWPIKFAPDLWPGSSPVLGDIDGDYDIEILIASDRLYAWHHNGVAVAKFPKIIPTGAQWWFSYAEGSSPVLADLDKDGNVEIVLGDEGIFGGAGHLFVWDLTGTYRQQTMEWPMFHYEKEHTAVYSTHNPRPPSRPSGVTYGTVNCTYSYSTSTFDPDGDNIRYKFDWGDGTSTLTGFYASNVTVSASHFWNSTGYYDVKVQAQDPYGAWSAWSLALRVSISSGGGGGGCPTLFVWNGLEYVDHGVIYIHDSSGSDVIQSVTLQTADVGISNYSASFRLREGWEGLTFSESVIDQVKLYAIDSNGRLHFCPLVKAEHSRLGDVLKQMLLSDDKRAQTLLMETIDLTFKMPYQNIRGYVFIIEGCNRYKT